MVPTRETRPVRAKDEARKAASAAALASSLFRRPASSGSKPASRGTSIGEKKTSLGLVSDRTRTVCVRFEDSSALLALTMPSDRGEMSFTVCAWCSRRTEEKVAQRGTEVYLGRRCEARKDLVVDGHRWTKLHEDGARQARMNVVAEVFIAETASAA